MLIALPLISFCNAPFSVILSVLSEPIIASSSACNKPVTSRPSRAFKLPFAVISSSLASPKITSSSSVVFPVTSKVLFRVVAPVTSKVLPNVAAPSASSVPAA